MTEHPHPDPLLRAGEGVNAQPLPRAGEGAGSISRTRERVRVRVRVRARELRRSSPDAGRAIWSALRSRQLDGYKFRRQHLIGRFFADFACVEAMLVVELDGGQHLEAEAIEADARRTRAMKPNGLHVSGSTIGRHWSSTTVFWRRSCSGCLSITLTPTLSRVRERESMPILTRVRGRESMPILSRVRERK